MAKVVLGLRIVQVVLAVGNLGLAAYLIDWYLSRTRFSSPHVFNFLLVAPIISLLSILYLELTPRFAPRASHAFAALAVESLNGLFYFAGFISTAVFISELSFCNGPQCVSAQASAAIAAGNFAAWMATTVLVAMDIFKGGLRAPSSMGSWGHEAPPPRAGGPMRQV